MGGSFVWNGFPKLTIENGKSGIVFCCFDVRKCLIILLETAERHTI